MVEFFAKLFEASEIFAQASLSTANDTLAWMHIVSDLLIFAALATCSGWLAWQFMRRSGSSFPSWLWLPLVALAACGVVHLIDASLYLHPWYRLSAGVKMATAVVSCGAVFGLVRQWPQVTKSAALLTSPASSDLARKNLAQIEEQFRAAIEAAPNAIVLIDATGRIVLVNTQAETLFAYEPGELPGLVIEALMPDRFWESHIELRSRYMRDPRQRRMGVGRDLVGLRRDGSEFPIEVGLNPLDTDQGQFVLCVIVDISERKRAEDTMRTLTQTLEQEVAQRTRLVTLQHDIAAICNQAESVDLAMRNAMRRICEHMSWPVGHVFLRNDASEEFEPSRITFFAEDAPDALHTFIEQTYDVNFTPGQGWLGQVVAKRLPQWAGDVSEMASMLRADALAASGIRSVFAFPVLVDDNVVAVIEFFSLQTSDPTYDLLSITQEVGRLLGRVAERFELQRAIAESVESEQRRIAEELHDGLGQELTAMSLMAKGLHRALESQQSPVADRAKDLAEAIPRVVRQTRAMVRGLMPVEIDAAGLMSALEQLADSTQRHHAVTCRLEAPTPVTVSNGTVAHHLFRIAQEALNNAIKHSGGDVFSIRLRQVEQELVLEVADNGRGIGEQIDHEEPLPRGMGMRIMKHRANLIGGTLAVLSTAAAGTTVMCRLKNDEVEHEW